VFTKELDEAAGRPLCRDIMRILTQDGELIERRIKTDKESFD
jgi:hypothetical protein